MRALAWVAALANAAGFAVLGAALFALDTLGSPAKAQAELRSQLAASAAGPIAVGGSDDG